MQRVLFLFLALLSQSAPGCAVAAGAALGIGVVHTTGEDSVELFLEAPREAVLGAARAELEARGTLDTASSPEGRLRGHVGGSEVKIAVAPASGSTVEVRVKARQNAGLSPDPETAALIANGIVRRTEGR